MRAEIVHKKIGIACLGSIAVLLPFSITGTSIATIALFLNWLVEGKFNHKLLLLKKRKLFWLFVAVYLLYAISISYSSDFSEGLKILETKLSLFILPMIIGSINISDYNIDRILLLFAISLISSTLIAFVHFANDQPSINFLLQSIKIDGLRDNYYAYTKIHPTYLSFYVVFSLFICAYLVITHKRMLNWKYKTVASGTILYLLILLVLLSSRMSQLSFVIIILLFIISYFLVNKSYLRLIVSLIAFSAIIYILTFNQTLSARFNELFTTSLSPPQGIHHNSTNIRVGIIICALELLSENWLTGFGIGETQVHLNECYRTKGFSDVMYLQSYGLHNAYFDIWLATGLFGLFIFITSLALPFYIAIKDRQFLYAAFLILFILSCFTESMLNTNKGVVVYSVFNSIFALSFYTKSKKVSYTFTS